MENIISNDQIISKFYNSDFDNKEEVAFLCYLVDKGLESTDENVKNIFSNVCAVKEIEPRFSVFLSKEVGSAYLRPFRAVNVNVNDKNDFFKVFHEYGHAMLNIISNTNVPENFESIIENAKQYALNIESENFQIGDLSISNGRFRDILEYICNKDTSKKNNIAVLSDIIGSMWNCYGFNNSKGKPFMLPYYHSQSVYQNRDGSINYKNLFDEQFANFFTLKSNNAYEELEVLNKLFGNEWYSCMEEQIIKINSTLSNIQEDNLSVDQFGV